MKRFLTLMLALLMVLSCCFVSCGEDETESEVPGGTQVDDETEATGKVDETEVPTETETTSETEITVPEDIDYKGMTVRLNVINTNGTGLELWNFFCQTTNPEGIHKAVYDRNATTEKYLGIKLSYDHQPYNWGLMDTWLGNIENSIKANNQAWELIATHGIQAARMTVKGLAKNLGKSDYIDFNSEWYPQGLVKAVGVKNKIYTIGSYASTGPLTALPRIYVNEDIMASLNVKSIYDIVEEGDGKVGGWTLDKFEEYARLGAKDANGNGVITVADDGDRFGAGIFYMPYLPCFYFAAGMTMADLDHANNRIVMDDIASQKSVDLATRMGAWWNTSGVAWNQPGDANGGGDNRHKTFSNGDAFMFVSDGTSIDFFRDTTFSWGAVILPKYDANQKMYYSQMYENCHMWLVPIDCKSFDVACQTLECLNYFGWDICVDAYIEDVLYSKAATSEQAAHMYDIMMAAVVFDFGTYYQCDMYNDGSTQSPFFRWRSAVNRNVNWATEWLIYKDGFMDGIDKLWDKLANLPD
jgi:hypothetical protein